MTGVESEEIRAQRVEEIECPICHRPTPAWVAEGLPAPEGETWGWPSDKQGRICEQCGKAFHGRADARFCSGRCRVAHHRRPSVQRIGEATRR